MTERADLSEKLLKNVISVFKKDSSIDEYDFLPVELPTVNANPVVHDNHKLGIEAWAVKLILSHCYCRMMSWLETHNNQRIKPSDSEWLSECSQIIVMVIHDCMTAWNIRKRLIEEKFLTVADDLQFSKLVLIKHPKSSETFFHRKWLLSRMLDDSGKLSKSTSETVKVSSSGPPGSQPLRLVTTPNNRYGGDIERQLEEELAVCHLAAERYANNYHAWTHRIWLIQKHCNNQVATKEFQSTHTFLEVHISDYSVYHYRLLILYYLGLENNSLRSMLLDELEMCSDLTQRYPGHEAIWVHRRAVVKLLLQCSQSVSGGSKKLKTGIHDILGEEKTFCDKVIEAGQSDGNDSWNSSLARRHLDCIQRFKSQS